MTVELAPDKSNWYRNFKIKKRSGGFRVIEEPNEVLKAMQREVLDEVLPGTEICFCAHGVIGGRNVQTAARAHTKAKIKLKMDISNFFGTVTEEMVKNTLEGIPHLKEHAEGIAFISTSKEGVLPQGAPTSPYLSAIVAKKMHIGMLKVCKNLGLKFSVYIDDITVSGDDLKAIRKAAYLLPLIAEKNGFSINKKKTKIMTHKQEVLGLCVEKGLAHTRLPKAKRKNLRAMVHQLRVRAEAGEKIPEKELQVARGRIAFAEMAKDQKAGLFKKQLEEIILKCSGR